MLQVLSKLKDATTRGHFGDDLDTLGNPAVVKNHIETLKDQVDYLFVYVEYKEISLYTFYNEIQLNIYLGRLYSISVTN